MIDKLKTFIDQLKTSRRIDTFDEAATKQAVVLRLLSVLGWDTFNIDEVNPEYSVASKRVDYSLRLNGQNKVFIEVKRIGIELENHQEQLLNYSFQQGVKLAVLTNGVTWWFYLPLNEGSWVQRKFYTIDILQQDANDIASKFIDFLLRDNINNGTAIINAEAIYRGQQKINILEETLPKAWNKIIEEADELLIDLINETAEKICGFKAETELVERFLSKNKNLFIILPTINRPTPPVPTQTTFNTTISEPNNIGNYTGKSISSFYFRGAKYEVRSWKDLLIKLCEIINSAHRNDFEKTLKVVGRKRPYFTRSANELRAPQKINDTNIYVETNLSANNIVKICIDMLAVFNYSESDFRIEAT
jgi:predicted type IV restriction endonuclease